MEHFSDTVAHFRYVHNGGDSQYGPGMLYWDNGDSDAIYHMNNDEVANLVWSGRAKPVQGGTAVVRDYTFNGIPTFQILSYEVWNIMF